MTSSSRNAAPAAQTPGFFAAWHAMGLVILAMLPGLKSRVPLWSPDSQDHAAWALVGAYLAGALLLAAIRGRRSAGAPTAVLVMLGAFGAAFLYFLLHKPPPELSRGVIAAMFGAGVLLAAAAAPARRFKRPALALLAIAAAAALALQLYRAYGPKHLHTERVQDNLATAFYTVHTDTWRNALPGTDVRGGGVSLIGDQYLLATGDGRMYVFDFPASGGGLSIHKLPYEVPLNIAEFTKDANPQGYAGKPNGGDEADRLQGVQTWQFRVAHVRVQERGDDLRVFVSHHFWKRAEQCFVVRVSSLSGSKAAFLAGDRSLAWKTVFESTPCIPLRGADSVHENNPFAGMEIGGRLALVNDDTLMLTLGDHDFTGVETKRMFSQEAGVSYGKTLLIHLNDGSSEIYSLGHRNPQGLYITPEGTIWSTEHGPQGGDELNLITRGSNYGWPLVTYGTDYGSAAWPLSHNQGRHDGFQQPIYVWIPSVGISNLIRIERDSFPVWKGDLLVGSLHGHALFRIRLLDQRVVFAEPIEVGERVRDIIEGKDGRIVLWTDTSSIMSLTPAKGTDGAVLFATTCGGCHKAIDGATQSYGPDLAGIVGSEVAASPGFGAYSPALKSLHGKWTRERLDKFLASPQSFAPGTAMTFRGVENAEQRAAVIEYLATTQRY